MNIQERIETLETEFNEKIKALKAEVQQEKEFPQLGDEYWYIDNDGVVMEMEWRGIEYDQGRLSIGNIFRTKEEAEFAVEKLKVEAELRKFSRPFKSDVENFSITFNTITGNLNVWYREYNQSQGTIYFESEEKARQAIKSVGEDRIKKYIFGVEG